MIKVEQDLCFSILATRCDKRERKRTHYQFASACGNYTLVVTFTGEDWLFTVNEVCVWGVTDWLQLLHERAVGGKHD